MKTSDPYPFHHRQITPWYATTAMYWILMVFMWALFAFSLVGISVARSEIVFAGYVWVPASLCTISATVILLLVWRLVRRWLQRKAGQGTG